MVHILQSPLKPQQNKQLNDLKTVAKVDIVREESGTKEDGSMGAWGGKKYEGLGMRDVLIFYK